MPSGGELAFQHWTSDKESRQPVGLDCLQLDVVNLAAQLTEFGRAGDRHRHLTGVGQHASSDRCQPGDRRANDLLAALPAISCSRDPIRSADVPLTQRLQGDALVEERFEIIQPEDCRGLS